MKSLCYVISLVCDMHFRESSASDVGFIFTAMRSSHEGVTIKDGIFMHSKKHVRYAMALYFVSLIYLVKLHDTVDPNSKIMTHSLRYKKNGET